MICGRCGQPIRLAPPPTAFEIVGSDPRNHVGHLPTLITGQGVANGPRYPIGTLNAIAEPKMKQTNEA
jgi:hypothetical protein